MGKNAGYLHFLLFPALFSKGFALVVSRSLPNDKILHWSKFKAFADDISNVAQMTKLGLDRLGNIVGKGENAGYQHFLLFSQCI